MATAAPAAAVICVMLLKPPLIGVVVPLKPLLLAPVKVTFVAVV